MAKKETQESLIDLGNLIVEQTKQDALLGGKHTTSKSSERQQNEDTPQAADADDDLAWSRFVEYAKDYDQSGNKTRGVTVWIDDDVKDVLDKLKSSGEVKVPVRHMVSAMCRLFIEEHKGRIVAALNKGKRKNSLL